MKKKGYREREVERGGKRGRGERKDEEGREILEKEREKWEEEREKGQEGRVGEGERWTHISSKFARVLATCKITCFLSCGFGEKRRKFIKRRKGK